MELDTSRKLLENGRKVGKRGQEYWRAREIQEGLGYETWDKFTNVIERAMKACDGIGLRVSNHFSRTGNMVSIGSGAQREKEDYLLSRYACYLIAMNGDPGKPEIAMAQTYFAVQTRRQELSDEATKSDAEQRIEYRARLTDKVKHLNSVAKAAGVCNYALFHDAGYRGLYGMGLAKLKQRKGLSPKDDLYDRAGTSELAANFFKATQTAERIERNKISGQEPASDTHFKVGQEVRSTIRRLGNTLPEDLVTESSIKALRLKNKKQIALPNAEPHLDV